MVQSRLGGEEPCKKIAAYRQALQIDSLFVEAQFNLGVAYKEQKNYGSAEPYLRQAGQAKSSELQLKALGELVGVYHAQGNTKSYEAALRQTKVLSRHQKQRAMISFELGRFLYQQGRHTQALAELKDGRLHNQGNEESFDKLIALAENGAQPAPLYAMADKPKGNGNIIHAKALPDFGDVYAPLAALDSLFKSVADGVVVAVDTVKTARVANKNRLPRRQSPIEQSEVAAPAEELLETTIASPDTSFVVANEQAEARLATEAALESLYQAALEALGREDWSNAIIILQKIRLQQPDYRDVDALFVMARTRLLAAEKIVVERPSTPVIAGLTAASFIMFLCGFTFFSPRQRARFHCWRGNDNLAALIYESMLARRPNRVKLYPALADIYLRLNRQDETAMEVYQQVLELNLATRHRDEIADLVTSHPLNRFKSNENGVQDKMAASNDPLLAAVEAQQNKNVPPPKKPRKKRAAVAVLNNENGTRAEIGKSGAVTNGALAANGELPVKVKAAPKRPRKKKAAGNKVTANPNRENKTMLPDVVLAAL